MKDETNIKLFLVDDDALYLNCLKIAFLNKGNFDIHTYATGEKCLENLKLNPDVVILDYHLDGINTFAMNGIEVLDRIKAFNGEIPVIMLSSQDKIEVAINCMHHKACDYVVKSETCFLRLNKIITTISAFRKIEKELKWYMQRM